MNPEIEILDKQRMRYLELTLIGIAAALILSVIRFFFRLRDLNAQPIGMAVLIGLILSVLLMAFSSLGSARLGRKIRNDPALKAALYNELVISLEIQSWRAAFLGAVATNAFFALTYFFYPVCDPVMVTLTSIIAGLGAYKATFYLKYRSA
jgi:hypothetical protein